MHSRKVSILIGSSKMFSRFRNVILITQCLLGSFVAGNAVVELLDYSIYGSRFCS